MKQFTYLIIMSIFLSSCGSSSSSSSEMPTSQTTATPTAEVLPTETVATPIPTQAAVNEDRSQVCTLQQAENLVIEAGYEMDLTQASNNTLVTSIDEECSLIVAYKLIQDINGIPLQSTLLSTKSTEPPLRATEPPSPVDPTSTPSPADPTPTPVDPTPTPSPADPTPTAVDPTPTPSPADPTPTPVDPTPTPSPAETTTTEEVIKIAEGEEYSKLKTTGQITPYIDESGNEYKDDGYYQAGIAQNDDSQEDIYEVRADNMLFDKVTNLTWYNSGQEGTISDATQICSNKGNRGEWRVPTIKELMTLMMYQYISPTAHPTVYNTLFKYTDAFDNEQINININVISQDYVSYTDDPTLTTSLYFARFGIGATGLFNIYDKEAIFCVSGESSYTSPIYDDQSGDEYIIDTTHNLMWQDQPENRSMKMNWFEALEYCEALELAGKDDWRMPNINELLSIYELSNSKLINSNFKYPHTGLGLWSSTTYANNTDYVYAGMLNYGVTRYIQRTSEMNVRCVRSENDNKEIQSTTAQAPDVNGTDDPSVLLPTWL
ncbi:MAG: DUF1566 domain-containing protein [Campylobacterota bacterium]|nr:DUF1566 domain-containing protein [Campylobacterota bacterium]